MSSPGVPPEPARADHEVVDVDALMGDLRRRVAEKKAKGLYGVDALVADALEDSGPVDAERLEALRALAVQQVDLTALPSSTPVVGELLGKVKSTMTRGVSQPLYVMAEQTNQFNGALLAYLSALSRQASEATARADRAEVQVASLAARIAALEERLARAAADDGGGRSLDA